MSHRIAIARQSDCRPPRISERLEPRRRMEIPRVAQALFALRIIPFEFKMSSNGQSFNGLRKRLSKKVARRKRPPGRRAWEEEGYCPDPLTTPLEASRAARRRAAGVALQAGAAAHQGKVGAVRARVALVALEPRQPRLSQPTIKQGRLSRLLVDARQRWHRRRPRRSRRRRRGAAAPRNARHRPGQPPPGRRHAAGAGCRAHSRCWPAA